MSGRSFGAAAFAAALAVGCKSADSDVEPIVTPKPIAFEGKIDPKYVGDWSTAGGASRLDLKPDGSAVIELTTNSRAGKSKTHYDGNWLAQDGSLLVQYTDSSHEATTLKYRAILAGGKLTLQQGGGRMKSIYTKK